MLVVEALYAPPVLVFPKLLYAAVYCGRSAAPLHAGHRLLSSCVSGGGVGGHEVPGGGHVPLATSHPAWPREECGQQLLDFITFVVVTESFPTRSA